VTIRHESFSSDVKHLIGAIERRLERSTAASTPGRAPAEDRRTAQLATWSSEADRAAAEDRWADAVILLENIRSLDPSYPDLTRRLSAAIARRTEQDGQAEARRHHLSGLYVRAGQAEAAGRLDEAVAALSELVRLDPANGDAARRLEALRQRGGSGFAPPAPLTQPTPFPPPTPAFATTPYGQPTPPPRPPDGSAGPAAYFSPPPERKRNRAWVIAAIAAVAVALVVVGVLVLPDRTGTVGRTTTTPTTNPPFDPPSSSPTPSATPSPTPGNPTGLSTSELRTHIPRDIRARCEDYVPPGGDPLAVKLVGALRCELTAKGSPAKVWYFEYADNAAMDTAYKPYTEGTFTTGDCTAKGQKMDYTTTEQGKKLPGGVLHCYTSEAGETYFAWTHDHLHVLSFAGDPDLTFAEMKKWWQSAGPYRQP